MSSWQKPTGSDSIPPLKSRDSWAKDPVAKATLFSETFSSKAKLPEPQVNEFSHIAESGRSLSRVLRIRTRDVLKILKNLDENSGTGPDLLPAKILRRCTAELALPITIVARLCLNARRWPDC